LAIGVAAAAAIGISVDQGGQATARHVALAAARPAPTTALLAVGSLDAAADWHRSVRQPSLVYHPPVARPRHQSAPASTPKADAIRVSSTTTTPLTSAVNRSSPTSSSSSTPVDSGGSVQSAPVQSAPVQSAPVQSAPVQSAPVQSAPVVSAPVQPTSGSGSSASGSGGGSGGSGTASGGG
jgi:hypothetical protein